MKKIIGTLSFFLVFALIVSLVAGFIGSIPSAVPENASAKYKLLVGVGYFLRYLPSVVYSGFLVSLSVYFGNNCEGSISRFSSAMLGRFKILIIYACACAFVLTMSTEVFGSLISRGKRNIINHQ